MIRFLLGLSVALVNLSVVSFASLSGSRSVEPREVRSAAGTCLDARIDELKPVTALCREPSEGAR
jgi:hypothetical protein